MKKFLVCLIAAFSMVSLVGCIKPYDEPEFQEVDTAETAFIIPLEGDTSDQSKFASEQFLDQKKVATKRVQITHRWVQTGRWEYEGKWVPNVRLVKVKRSPVTREWTADPSSGTSNKNQAVWAESQDSVAFSLGWTCTGYVDEADTARFLYRYPSGSLETVMDSEIRGRFQQISAEVAARYPLDSLRSKKQEIVDAVRKDATVFFKERGITITTIGMFGGMTYENPDIQKAIDNVFVAQQLKNVNLAKFEAQQKDNERIELEASATANAARTKAKGEADALREINKAAEEAKTNPMVLSLRALEIEKLRNEKWDGKYPTYMVGGMGQSNLLLQLPIETSGKK